MKSVLITGASGGIGAATAALAARKGWRVFAGYRAGKERAQALAGQSDIRPLKLSLDQAADIEAATDAVATAGEGLDAVVLCACPPLELLPFAKTGPASLQAHFAATAGHQLLLASLWKSLFSKAGGGHVVAVSSLAAGHPPAPYVSAYVAAKRGLEAMLECALAEYGGRGLRGTVLRPDYTETSMLLSLGEHYLEAIRAKLAGHRMLKAEEVGQRIVASLESPPRSTALEMLELECPRA